MLNHARRHLPAIGLIVALAVSVRVTWSAFVRPDPTDGRFDDTVWYRGAAHFLAEGAGYVNPFTGTPTAAWPPGYPAFLGGVFKAFGEGFWQTAAANIALAAVTAVIVYAIGLRVFDRRTATIAAVAVALWPGQVYFSSLTLSEPLFTALFAVAVLLIVLVPAVTGSRRAALLVMLGVVAGAAVLTRGQALLLLPLALAFWSITGVRWRTALAWSVVMVAVVGVMIAPWMMRNEQRLGSPVLLATNVGPNCWIGHHEGATGRMPTWEPIPVPDRTGLTQPQYEVRANELALEKCVSYMATHPIDELRLAREKIRAMYESDATALDWNAGYSDGFYASDAVEHALRGAANVFWFAALALAALGLVVSRASIRGPAVMLPLLVVGWTLTHLLFFGDPRFHYPIAFALALLGARGLVVLGEMLRRPQPVLGRKRYAPA
jgi:4-amino-4-deoxy-L-arabinose transferase-like glycosyltransferase